MFNIRPISSFKLLLNQKIFLNHHMTCLTTSGRTSKSVTSNLMSFRFEFLSASSCSESEENICMYIYNIIYMLIQSTFSLLPEDCCSIQQHGTKCRGYMYKFCSLQFIEINVTHEFITNKNARTLVIRHLPDMVR